MRPLDLAVVQGGGQGEGAHIVATVEVDGVLHVVMDSGAVWWLRPDCCRCDPETLEIRRIPSAWEAGPPIPGTRAAEELDL